MQIGYFLGNMGYVILQKWLFAVRFLVVWVLQSPYFETNFETNLKLTHIFACQKSLFRFHLDHQKNASVWGGVLGVFYTHFKPVLGALKGGLVITILAVLLMVSCEAFISRVHA